MLLENPNLRLKSGACLYFPQFLSPHVINLLQWHSKYTYPFISSARTTISYATIYPWQISLQGCGENDIKCYFEPWWECFLSELVIHFQSNLFMLLICLKFFYFPIAVGVAIRKAFLNIVIRQIVLKGHSQVWDNFW